MSPLGQFLESVLPSRAGPGLTRLLPAGPSNSICHLCVASQCGHEACAEPLSACWRPACQAVLWFSCAAAAPHAFSLHCGPGW